MYAIHQWKVPHPPIHLFSCTQFDLWNFQRIINFQFQQRTLSVGTQWEIRCLIIDDFQILIVNDNLLGCTGSILALDTWHQILRLTCLLAVDLDLPEFFFHLRSRVLQICDCSDLADTKSLLADHLDSFDLVLSSHNSNNQSYTCISGVAWLSKWVLFLVIWERLPEFTLLQVIRQNNLTRVVMMKLLGEEFATTNNTTSIPSREKNKNSTSVEINWVCYWAQIPLTDLKTFEPHNLTAVRNKMPPQSVVAHHEAL